MKRLTKLCSMASIGSALTGCGGASTGEGPDLIEPPSDPPFVLPAAYQPVLESNNLTALINDIDFAMDAERTSRSEILPRGTARYAGGAAMTFDFNSPQAGNVGVVGEMTAFAELNFAGDDFRATIKNMHLFSGSVVQELIVGDLQLVGELDDGQKTVTGSLSGELSGYFATQGLIKVDVNGSFAGTTGDLFGITRPGPLGIGTTTPEYEAAVISGALTASTSVKIDRALSGGTVTGRFGVTDVER